MSSIDQFNAACDRPGHPRLKGRARFEAFAEFCGSTAIDEENAILSAGREFLPACAQAVLDDRSADPSEEYWDFLTSQTAQAQDEHDATVAAGHEWHG